MRWASNVVHRAELINANKFLVGKPEGTRTSGRSALSWVYNIEIHLKVIVVGVDHLARVKDQLRDC
jgi:hypothetical protein